MRENNNILLVCFALVLAGLACQTSVLGVPVAISTPTSIPSVSQVAPTPSPAPSRAPSSAQEATRPSVVCFRGIENGILRVRECPGLGCREVWVLISGDPVAVTGEQKVIDGSAWLQIDAPVDGWVNARYVCKARHK